MERRANGNNTMKECKEPKIGTKQQQKVAISIYSVLYQVKIKWEEEQIEIRQRTNAGKQGLEQSSGKMQPDRSSRGKEVE
jgi:hypothetical protein